MVISGTSTYSCRNLLEVAGVTFSDWDSTPVPKFLNPDPNIFQISESDSCSDSGYNRGNVKLPMVFLHKLPCSLLLLTKMKSDTGSDPIFQKFLILVSSENSDLCEISELSLFVSHFPSQSKGIKFGKYFLMCVV